MFDIHGFMSVFPVWLYFEVKTSIKYLTASPNGRRSSLTTEKTMSPSISKYPWAIWLRSPMTSFHGISGRSLRSCSSVILSILVDALPYRLYQHTTGSKFLHSAWRHIVVVCWHNIGILVCQQVNGILNLFENGKGAFFLIWWRKFHRVLSRVTDMDSCGCGNVLHRLSIAADSQGTFSDEQAYRHAAPSPHRCPHRYSRAAHCVTLSQTDVASGFRMRSSSRLHVS